jgi:hypothetical protein
VKTAAESGREDVAEKRLDKAKCVPVYTYTLPLITHVTE